MTVNVQFDHSASPLLSVRDLAVDYVARRKPPAHALVDVSFDLRPGEALGLVGESGCGKTTLALSLMRLLPAAGRIVAGHILLDGRDLLDLSEREMEAVRWKNVSMIFQGAMNALNPVKTVGEQIGEAVRLHTAITDSAAVNRRIVDLLDMVGIASNRVGQYPHQYSGGMRQRAMIAMALACDPQIVIADEPTTALDVMIQAQILELMGQLRRELNLAIIFVTHDLGIVAEMCDSVLVMYGGMTAEYADVDTIYNEPRHPYTQELLNAFPDLTHPGERLTSIPGYPPRLDALPPGCRFAPRCPRVLARCRSQIPELYRINGGHHAGCFLVAGDPA